MLDNNVIEPSSATEFSQVHLQPKPEGKWRFCVDLRNLNLASKGRGWPIPNIPQMLRRIGDHKAKFFASMDMTGSFHQAPLSITARFSWHS
jgi:hypothetical protein